MHGSFHADHGRNNAEFLPTMENSFPLFGRKNAIFLPALEISAPLFGRNLIDFLPQTPQYGAALLPSITGIAMSNEITVPKPPRKRRAPQATKLNALKFSPEVNPLAEMIDIKSRNKYIRTGKPQELVNQVTGEINNVAIVHTIEEYEDIQFVKVFAAGVRAVYNLNKTATKVFSIVLEHYQSTPMSGGFVDSVYISWFDGGLLGQDMDISEKSFREGLRDLIDNGFLSPKSPNVYWVNPSLFFKGDRVAFVKEYQRKRAGKKAGKLAAPNPEESTQGGLFNEGTENE